MKRKPQRLLTYTMTLCETFSINPTKRLKSTIQKSNNYQSTFETLDNKSYGIEFHGINDLGWNNVCSRWQI